MSRAPSDAACARALATWKRETRRLYERRPDVRKRRLEQQRRRRASLLRIDYFPDAELFVVIESLAADGRSRSAVINALLRDAAEWLPEALQPSPEIRTESTPRTGATEKQGVLR